MFNNVNSLQNIQNELTIFILRRYYFVFMKNNHSCRSLVETKWTKFNESNENKRDGNHFLIRVEKVIVEIIDVFTI